MIIAPGRSDDRDRRTMHSKKYQLFRPRHLMRKVAIANFPDFLLTKPVSNPKLHQFTEL